MKARVKINNHEFYNKIFNVGFLSFEMVAGMEEETKSIVAAAFEDVEYIFDAPWEEKIIKNKEILNIKKPKEASYYMHFAIISALEEHINEEVQELQILSDIDVPSKGPWAKRIKIAVNGRPVLINITGKKYSNEFDIRTTDMDKNEFLTECEGEIEKVKSGLKLYTKRLNGLMYTIQLIKNDKITKNTSKLDKKSIV